MRHAPLSLIAAGALAGAAQAQAPPPAPDATVSGVTVVAHRATPLAGVTVTANVCPEPDAARYGADPAPAVVDTYPQPDSIVPPGALVLRASFAAPMSCYWEVTSESDSEDDPCQEAGSWALPARTSWTMVCKLKPGARYKIRFGKADGHGFVGRSGQAAPPYVLNFSTSNDPPLSAPDAWRLSREGAKEPPASAYVTCSARPANVGADCIRTSAAGSP
jgi:hypothetical protein